LIIDFFKFLPDEEEALECLEGISLFKLVFEPNLRLKLERAIEEERAGKTSINFRFCKKLKSNQTKIFKDTCSNELTN